MINEMLYVRLNDLDQEDIIANLLCISWDPVCPRYK